MHTRVVQLILGAVAAATVSLSVVRAQAINSSQLVPAVAMLNGDPAPVASVTRRAPTYRGVLTFATTGSGDPVHPAMVQDLDLTSGQMSVRFYGLDATRTRSGETAFLARLGGGDYADHGIVVADTRGIPGPPLFLCKAFNSSDNRLCGSPKLAPDGSLVAFAARGAGTYCTRGDGMSGGDFIVVVDRQGNQVARFEGYGDADWLRDGRLLMMGSACRSAGVWVVDQTLRSLSRIDGGQVSVPGSSPTVRPDGRAVAFVWNNQLWSLSLVGRPDLTQLTSLGKPVTAAAWSPDGRAIAALMLDETTPTKSVVLFRPGDQSSVTVHPLEVYPYGPVSWR